jgi:hypothetical protein
MSVWRLRVCGMSVLDECVWDEGVCVMSVWRMSVRRLRCVG